MKTFYGDLLMLKDKLARYEPFAFNRFSDGEFFILKNMELILGDGIIKMGNTVVPGPYKKEDFKHFDPTKHQFIREKLIEAFRFSKPGYHKGISCRCCMSPENYAWQMEFMKDGKDGDLTWSNLFVNSNYPLFLEQVLPEFYNYKTVMICNVAADLSEVPFLVKDFRVGENAMVNDYSLIETIKRWIVENEIKKHLFLFSASAFSKMAIHQLYEFNDENTYIDIGTTLNPYIGLSLYRGYLQGYWLKSQHPDITKTCIW